MLKAGAGGGDAAQSGQPLRPCCTVAALPVRAFSEPCRRLALPSGPEPREQQEEQEQQEPRGARHGMDAPSVGALLALPALLQLAAAGGSPGPGALLRGCPARCRCELDGRTLLRVDCADLGLAAPPADLSAFTSFL